MAYNLQPLIQTLEHILYPQPHRRPYWILDPTKKPLIESLLAKARLLNELFENPSSLTGQAVGSLESRIRDAAYHAQNVIESHLADQLLSNKYSKRITISPPDSLEEIADLEFVPVFDKLMDIVDGRHMGRGPSSSDLVSSSADLNPKNIVVGINEDVILLKAQLIMPHESKLQIIPIVGMGGIGKTTLAQTLYDDQAVVSYFDSRAWITISQSYSEREMMLGLLKCVNGNQDRDNDLGTRLYKNLWGRRYLIVLDDMWSSEAWDCIGRYFPKENNGSRILVTTREQNVGNCVASSEKLHHQMKLLDEVESWKLLRKKVFADEESHPIELEKIAKNIAKDCRGLPLAIHVVGGVLARSEQTQDAWEQVAMDASSLAKNDEQVSHILSLSYNHLPSYLKPCFLYMGSFPKDCVIKPSRLVRLWMAEGFLKPISGKSLEETARVYLRELVERNLLSVGQQETRRNVKSYNMHDLLRDLCIRKAQEEKFLYGGIDAINDLNPKEMLQLRLRVHASSNQFTPIIECPGVPYVMCSILLFSAAGFHGVSWLHKCAFGMQLLKVLDMLEANFAELPRAMERLVNLRYLAARISNAYPHSISNLCNLQTLIFDQQHSKSYNGTAKEILDMPQLRHIKFKGAIPLFVLEDEESVNNVVNEELQTLSMVKIDDSFPRILKAIPNLKKLGISSGIKSSTIDLSSLSQLQTLKCLSLRGQSLNLIFQPSLKKLTLRYCEISREFLNEIGGLPNLHVFKVQYCYVPIENEGEWQPTQGEFQQLRLLQLKMFRGLKKWIADETHYPRLEHLIIKKCYKLEEIPSGIGFIPTLEVIELRGQLTSSLLESAWKIKLEQSEYGNDALQLRITLPAEAWAKKVAVAMRAVTNAGETVIVEEVETKVTAEAAMVAGREVAAIVEKSATNAVVEMVEAAVAAMVEAGASKAVLEAVEAAKGTAIAEAVSEAVKEAKVAVEQEAKKGIAKAKVDAVAKAMEAAKVEAWVAANAMEVGEKSTFLGEWGEFINKVVGLSSELFVEDCAVEESEIEEGLILERYESLVICNSASPVKGSVIGKGYINMGLSHELFLVEESEIGAGLILEIYESLVICNSASPVKEVAMRPVREAVAHIEMKVIPEAARVAGGAVAARLEESATDAAVGTVEAVVATVEAGAMTVVAAVKAVKANAILEAVAEAVQTVKAEVEEVSRKAVIKAIIAVATKVMEPAKVEAMEAAKAMEAAQRWKQWQWKQRKWTERWKQPRNDEEEETDENGYCDLIKGPLSFNK